MVLHDWNKSLEYAKGICKEASEINHLDIRYSVYSMSDNRKGISIDVYDNYGNIHTYYRSGIQKDYISMVCSLNYCIKRAVTENC